MNDREFDAFLRDALRQPTPSEVPESVRAEEIARTVSAVVEDLLWGDADAATDDDDGGYHGSSHHRDHDSHLWDTSARHDPDSDLDEDGEDDDPLLASEPFDHGADHGGLPNPEYLGGHDFEAGHQPTDHGGTDGHVPHEPGPHHDGF